MFKKSDEIKQGHWILARMGKRVLRPGGKELTTALINSLDITPKDDIVEFAPGMGFTAGLALEHHPHTYVGVDADQDVIERLKEKLDKPNRGFVLGNAAETGLPEDSKDKVYGEAMLTMHADHRKSEIIREAHRILKKGGLYGIHELGLVPNNIDDDTKSEIQRELAQVIKVNARPLTENEWKALLENEGFKVVKVISNPMHLLEPKRVIDDEGFFRSLKIAFNVLTHPKARKRIMAMRKVFRKYDSKINSVAIVAQKA